MVQQHTALKGRNLLLVRPFQGYVQRITPLPKAYRPGLSSYAPLGPGSISLKACNGPQLANASVDGRRQLGGLPLPADDAP